ncbi:MAG: DsbA family protein [Acidimicrobiia bacterium]|nr:DsbA family protein [Acidimicrobiia bacterium]
MTPVDQPTEAIEFFFDPMCPWAYQTSVWIREVREQVPLDITWRFFSLEEINRVEGKKHPWEREWSFGWSQMRVGALLRRQGHEHLDAWYAAAGSAFHREGRRTHEREVHRELLAELGHDPALVDEAIADQSTTDEVRADHDHAVARHGAFGVPTIVLPGDHAVFGPVITPAPTGEAAARLWTLVRGWNEFPHLYELTHPKTKDDQRHIADSFDPYLRSRAWNTVSNPAP